MKAKTIYYTVHPMVQFGVNFYQLCSPRKLKFIIVHVKFTFTCTWRIQMIQQKLPQIIALDDQSTYISCL